MVSRRKVPDDNLSAGICHELVSASAQRSICLDILPTLSAHRKAGSLKSRAARSVRLQDLELRLNLCVLEDILAYAVRSLDTCARRIEELLHLRTLYLNLPESPGKRIGGVGRTPLLFEHVVAIIDGCENRTAIDVRGLTRDLLSL